METIKSSDIMNAKKFIRHLPLALPQYFSSVKSVQEGYSIVKQSNAES